MNAIHYYLLYIIHINLLLYPLISAEKGEAFNAAFVIPVVTIGNKEYIIVGREAGGKDARTYCIPGGSSSGWFWRERNPIVTASRELIEELLLDWSWEYTYNKIKNIENSKQKITINGKRIIAYKLSLTEKEKNTIINGYYKKRASYPFWCFSYREMDRIALIEKDDLLKSLHNCQNFQKCKCPALVRNPETERDDHIIVIIRPIFAHIMAHSYTPAKTNAPL